MSFMVYIKLLWGCYRENLEKLDEDRAFLQAAILRGASLYSDSDVTEFNEKYASSFRRARALAERNLRRLTSRKARSQFLCWDILKRLRPSPGG